MIEDDDYYTPRYLSTMVERLKGYFLVGEIKTIYYNVTLRGYIPNHNVRWASLFQTALTPEVIPVLSNVCRNRHIFVDMYLFKDMFKISRSKVNLFVDGNLAIGIKGLPGRWGIGMGHRKTSRLIPDPDFTKLKELIGEDYKYYE